MNVYKKALLVLGISIFAGLTLFAILFGKLLLADESDHALQVDWGRRDICEGAEKMIKGMDEGLHKRVMQNELRELKQLRRDATEELLIAEMGEFEKKAVNIYRRVRGDVMDNCQKLEQRKLGSRSGRTWLWGDDSLEIVSLRGKANELYDGGGNFRKIKWTLSDEDYEVFLMKACLSHLYYEERARQYD